jgi:glycerate kinase
MIIIAPDKFKGSLTAIEVCDSIEEGLLKVIPDLKIKKFPLSDGGNGFLEVVNHYIPKLQLQTLWIKDPLLKTKINTKYLSGNNTAYIETAESSGLHLIRPEHRNPMNTSTVGLGQVIFQAINSGYKKVFVGLGGSSSTDGGIGIASSLGFEFIDKNGHKLTPIGKNLIKIKSIIPHEIKINSKIYAVADVQNYLYGQTGAAQIFAQQKGATNDDIGILDDGLQNLAEIILKIFSIDINSVAGSGAAGGAGAGLKVFAGAQIIDGAEYVKDISGISELWAQCSLLVTGEGKLDEQTGLGKICLKISSEASKYGVKTIAIVGKNELDLDKFNSFGLSHVFQLQNDNIDHYFSIENAKELLIGKSMEIAQKLLKENSII